MIINIFHLCERQFTETVRDVNATGEICAIRSVKIYVFASIVAEYATNQQANRCFSCVSCFNPRTRDSQTQTLSRQNGTLSMSNWIISCYLSVCSMLKFLSCGGSVVIVVGVCVCALRPIYVQFIGIKMTMQYFDGPSMHPSMVSISHWKNDIHRYFDVPYEVRKRRGKKPNIVGGIVNELTRSSNQCLYKTQAFQKSYVKTMLTICIE